MQTEETKHVQVPREQTKHVQVYHKGHKNCMIAWNVGPPLSLGPPCSRCIRRATSGMRAMQMILWNFKLE
jgi:hypothetical protein